KSNDHILVRQLGGYGRIDEKILLPDKTTNPFVINSVKIFGKEIYPEGENHDHIVLPHDQNSFSVDFTVIDFLNSSKIRYSYKLEGSEGKEWTNPSGSRFTEFTNLPGGDYIFKLKASNQEGNWSPEKNLLFIHIETPFWKTTWFFTLIVLACLTMVMLLYFYQAHRNKRISQLQLQALHTQMRPHFIFNCLSAINSHIIKFETVKASEFLGQFSRLMRGILENSTESWITLEQEMETLRLYLVMETLRFEDKFSYKIEVEEGVIPAKTLIPSMILQPYVENAIGHGLLHKEHGLGIINIKFLKGEGNLKCIIEDNGIGRERSKQIKQRSQITHKSLGLQITSERLQLLQGNAKADIQDLKNEFGEPTGTRIIVMLMTKKIEEKVLDNLN
ncbi:MAG TPA: histidine kinase, partial [Cyclobacteriaceae bacterium]|nr:histidine kinase [Cyclobacteriaceae bacterium]